MAFIYELVGYNKDKVEFITMGRYTTYELAQSYRNYYVDKGFYSSLSLYIREKELITKFMGDYYVNANNILHKDKIIQAIKDGEARHLNLSGIDLSNSNLEGVNLAGKNLYRTNFTNSNLRNSNFYGATLCEANFESADLENANLSYVDVENAIFTGANIKGINLRGTLLEKLDFQHKNKIINY